MKLLIIRHGDPDYANDTLTERGHKEAKLLAEHLAPQKIDHIYVSPLGRARATAEYTLRAKGMDGTVCDWLREFPAKILHPDQTFDIPWDWRPSEWTPIEEFYSLKQWASVPTMVEGGVPEAYDNVVKHFDELLSEHGYVREENYYRVTRANTDTIAFFCHFGLECVLLSRLLGISPMVLWHGTCAAPTSVTVLNTEERQEGIACFRMAEFGSITHLTMAGEAPSFSARFCERYVDSDQRHD